jgi:hypothetical protein
MQRHYATPILLVESIDKLELTKDQEKHATAGKKRNDQETDEEALAPTTSVQARLAMLALAYPRLRLVWSKDGNSHYSSVLLVFRIIILLFEQDGGAFRSVEARAER